MFNIILAAGYATRMYPLTENFPKPLLPIGDTTIMDRLMADADRQPEVEGHIVVSNHKFIGHFEAWLQGERYEKPVRLIDDGSSSNDNRIGAVRDLLLALKPAGNADVMVLAADNVLDFSLRGFIDFFHQKGTSLIMCHHEDSIAALQRTGVVCLDSEQRVLLMEEKPVKPKTHWAVPPFYIYSHNDFPLIRSAIDNGCGFDDPGNLAHYLCEHSVMHAWPMTGHRIDIGNLTTYERIKNMKI